MQKFILIPILIFLLCCSVNYSKKSDLAKMNLKGKVSYLKTNEFNVIDVNGKIEKQSVKDNDELNNFNNEYFFNDYGMISIHNEYNLDSLTRKIVYNYNENLSIKSKDYFNHFGELITSSYFQNNFNKKGELIEQKEIRTDKSFSYWKTIKKFKDRNEIKEIWIFNKDTFDIKEMQYSKNGNIIVEKLFSNENKVDLEKYFKYDKTDNISEINFVKTISNSESKVNFTYLAYDDSGNWTKSLMKNDKEIKLIERVIKYEK